MSGACTLLHLMYNFNTQLGLKGYIDFSDIMDGNNLLDV